MKTVLKSLLAASFVLVAAPAFAKGGKNVQNHKCMKDGAEVAGVTKKECKKQGGKWEKGAPAAAAGGEAAPAPAPAPAGGTTP